MQNSDFGKLFLAAYAAGLIFVSLIINPRKNILFVIPEDSFLHVSRFLSVRGRGAMFSQYSSRHIVSRCLVSLSCTIAVCWGE